MTIEEKQEYLSSYAAAVRELRYLDEPADRVQEMLLAYSQTMRSRREAVRKEAEQIVRTCERSIAAVQDDVLQKALELRFLRGLPWETVADELGYSYSHIYRIRRAALAAVQL